MFGDAGAFGLVEAEIDAGDVRPAQVRFRDPEFGAFVAGTSPHDPRLVVLVRVSKATW